VKRINRVQRLARKEEGDIIKRIVLLSVLSVVIIILIFTIGVPLLGGFADLLGRILGNKSSTDSSQSAVPSAPILESLPSATNSATLAVSGFASDGNKVEIFLGSSKVGESDVSAGKFNYQSVNLVSGQNEISAKSLSSSGKESESSVVSKVTLDTIAPKLTVDNPSEGQSFSGVSKIVVEGTSDLDAEVLANGFLAKVGSDGKYEVTIALLEGENSIEVKAIDNAGNTTVVKVKVTFHP